MAVSNASFSGPTKAEYELQSRQQLRQGFDSLGNAIFDNRKFGEGVRQFDTEQERLRAVAAEQQRQFNVQRASQDLSEYIKAQGGDMALISQKNPEAFKAYARLAFPQVNPEEFVLGLQNGAQTPLQMMNAQIGEVMLGNVVPEMAQEPQIDYETVPGATPPAPAPKQTQPGTTPGGKTPSRVPNQTSVQYLDTGEEIKDWDKLRKAFKSGDKRSYWGMGDYGIPALPFDSGERNMGGKDFDITSARERSRALGRTVENKDATIDKLRKDIENYDKVLLDTTKNLSTEAYANVARDRQFSQRRLDSIIEADKELQGLTSQIAEYEKREKERPAETQEGLSAKELRQVQNSPEYQAVQKMMRDQGITADQAIAALANSQVQFRGSPASATGARYDAPANRDSSVQMPASGTQPQTQSQDRPSTPTTPATQAKVETAQKVDQVAGTEIAKYMGKDIATLSSQDRAKLMRELDDAKKKVIRKFTVDQKLNPGSQEALVAQRYASMSNALLGLGLDLPQTHPVMREVMQFSRDIDETNKRADTKLKLAQAALAEAGIMTKEQAAEALEIERQKIANETAKINLAKNEHYQNVLKSHFDALDDAIKLWQANPEFKKRGATNSFADAYKYNPQVKQLWDNIQGLYEKAGVTPPDIPPEVTYSEISGNWLRNLPLIGFFTSRVPVTVGFGGSAGGGGGTPQPQQQQQEINPQAGALIEEYDR